MRSGSVWRYFSRAGFRYARFDGSLDRRRMLNEKVRRVEVVLAGDPDQGEQRIATSVGQSRSHTVRSCGLAARADRPVRRDPFPGGMGQQRGQPDLAAILVDRGGLNRGNFVLAEAL